MMIGFRNRVPLGLAVAVLISTLPPVAAQAQFSQQGPKLVGSGAIGGAFQGNSVSLSADGNTAIVGGPRDDDTTGAAWVYTRSGGVWDQQAKLVGTGAIGNANQGSSVALSGDGDTAIVGGPADNHTEGVGVGAAWVFTRHKGVWRQQAKLVGGGAIGVESQGTSVSLSFHGSTAIIGGPNDNLGTGAAWVFTREKGVWSQQAKLVGTGAAGNAEQGISVSLSDDGNTAIVGGPFDDGAAGAAWAFTRSRGVWSQQGPKLVGAGAVTTTLAVEQGFSVSISGDGDTTIVGGRGDNGGAGAAWVFERAHAVWIQQAKLVGTGAVGPAGQGLSVSLSGDGNTAIVGGEDDNSFVGAAWVFRRSHREWGQQAKLLGADAVGNALQGASVAVSDGANTIIVGGPGDNGGVGAAWVYAQPVFAGTPGRANCFGGSVSALAAQFGGLNAAAASLGYPSARALQGAILANCAE